MADPLVYQVMTGKGSPVAVQERTAPLPSITVRDELKAEIFGATV